MEIEELIRNPELMDRDTLYELRSLLALYPYYQTARLLMLQNLYLLHDPSFDEELHRAAIYITDRRVLFQLVEAAHYRMKTTAGSDAPAEDKANKTAGGDRTISLIDKFLGSMPEGSNAGSPKRKPTPADAAVDYVAYLMETSGETSGGAEENAKPMAGQKLIDNFINDKKGGRVELKDEPEYVPEAAGGEAGDGGKASEQGVFTETLAQIYIKQGRYEKALEIIKRLNLNYPKKSIYFADQIRFLDKLIINSNKKR